MSHQGRRSGTPTGIHHAHDGCIDAVDLRWARRARFGVVRAGASRRLLPHTGGVDRSSISFMFGPMVALLVVGVLALLLRWAFGHGHSLVERRARMGTPQEYGLLVQVAAPATVIEAEIVRRRLVEAGLRATLTTTTEGPAVMVFADDAAAARALLEGT